MSLNKKVSVILPAYNKEQFVSDCIKSVLCQTFEHFELIIIIEPSTDNTEAICRKFNDKRIKFINKDKNGKGGYAARNLGIKNSQYEWIYFIDADDIWHPSHIEFSQNILSQTGVSFFSSSWLLNQSEFDKNLELKISNQCLINLEKYIELETNKLRPTTTSAICVSKKLIEKVGGFPDGVTSIGGDVDTWFRLMIECKVMVYSKLNTVIKNETDSFAVTKIELMDPTIHILTINNYFDKEKIKHSKLYVLLRRRVRFYVWFYLFSNIKRLGKIKEINYDIFENYLSKFELYFLSQNNLLIQYLIILLVKVYYSVKKSFSNEN